MASKPLKIEKVDKTSKIKDDKETTEWKVTLKDKLSDFKLVIKSENKSWIEDYVGPLKVKNEVTMKLENTQTKLDDHTEESED